MQVLLSSEIIKQKRLSEGTFGLSNDLIKMGDQKIKVVQLLNANFIQLSPV